LGRKGGRKITCSDSYSLSHQWHYAKAQESFLFDAVDLDDSKRGNNHFPSAAMPGIVRPGPFIDLGFSMIIVGIFTV
jgi:hypothetical protein